VTKSGRKRCAVVVALLAAPLVLAACSSGPSTSSGSGSETSGGGGATAALAKAPAAVCQQLDGILSDGPDPGADPVGYALSQIRQLRALRSSDTALDATTLKLAEADQVFVNAAGNDKAAAAAIKKDDAAINTACPGVAQ
jgi:hypothetical protein